MGTLKSGLRRTAVGEPGDADRRHRRLTLGHVGAPRFRAGAQADDRGHCDCCAVEEGFESRVARSPWPPSTIGAEASQWRDQFRGRGLRPRT